VLLGAGWLLLAGCGSESPPGPPGSAAGKQPTASPETGAGPVKTIPPPVRAGSGEAPGPLLYELLPPEPGQVGLSEAELRSGPPPLDPETFEIGPPRKPGERGLTLRDLEPPSGDFDPEVVEVVPPLRPGERGMTQAELERLLRSQGPPPAVMELLPEPPK
jgi:hypothetical protein